MVLHISNDYTGSKVYINLVKAIDKIGIRQIIYTPVRSEKLIGKNNISFENNDSSVHYRFILKTYTRFNYLHKIRLISSDINKTVDLSQVEIIHAHTWFSDGGAAYKLYQEHGIPYIITIRNTDLNIFFKYFIHLRSLGIKILLHAQQIIFISPVYKERFIASIKNHPSRQVLESKILVIPNGIDAFWLQNIYKREADIIKGIPQLLYVGNFSRNKNVLRLMKAVKSLNGDNMPCQLHLVGEGGKDFVKVESLIRENSDLFFYHGKISEHEKLRDLFRNSHVFVMPSKTETFGLVYVEALSQGLPVLYAKHEGIDGYFPDEIGEKVDPYDLPGIGLGIRNLIVNYQKHIKHINIDLNAFSWEVIAGKYEHLYTSKIVSKLNS